MNKKIAPIIMAAGSRFIFEPFCGALSVTNALHQLGATVIASDASLPLISLHQGIQNHSFIPPSTTTKQEWIAAQDLPDSDPAKGYYGFALSFGGMWFSHYIEDKPPRYYSAEASRSVVRAVKDLSRVTFHHLDFLSLEPEKTKVTLYLDPPYANTEPYQGVPSFDHELFWERARQWASKGATVLVSEQSAPKDIPIIWESRAPSFLGTNAKAARLERLYRL